jgi:hypothetical protein
VALGEPGTPVTCCAEADPRHAASATAEVNTLKALRAFIASLSKMFFFRHQVEFQSADWSSKQALQFKSPSLKNFVPPTVIVAERPVSVSW